MDSHLPKPARADLAWENPETILTNSSKLDINKGNPTPDNKSVSQKLPCESEETARGIIRTQYMSSVSLTPPEKPGSPHNTTQFHAPRSFIQEADQSDSARSPKRSPTPSDLLEKKLQQSVFSGCYLDRCWIEPLQSYRDRIQVDIEEEAFVHHLKSTLRKIKKNSLGSTHQEFYGIEKNGGTFNIYIDWRQESKPFGHYWFIIDKVELIHPQNFLTFNMRILRSISPRDFASAANCSHCGKPIVPIPDGDPFNFSDMFKEWMIMFQPTVWWHKVCTHLTAMSFVNGIKFVFLLTAALVSGAASLSVNLLTIFNRTIHELGYFVHQATPLFLGFFEIVSRCVGGLYLLVSMMWRDYWRPAQPPRQPNVQSVGFSGKEQKFPYQRRNIQRPYLSFENK